MRASARPARGECEEVRTTRLVQMYTVRVRFVQMYLDVQCYQVVRNSKYNYCSTIVTHASSSTSRLYFDYLDYTPIEAPYVKNSLHK
jgi:hypothetical protein